MIVVPIHILSTNPTSDDDDLEDSSPIPFFADSLNCGLAGPDHDGAPLHTYDGCSHCASSDLEITIVPIACLSAVGQLEWYGS